jgi:large subunit ribosomal protein L4
MEAPVRTQDGAEDGSVELADSVFGVAVNQAVLHQAVVRQLAGARQGTHDTKTRGEVSGGGRKPYRQKGTGRARQGSIRAPHWRGGGTVFGPTPRDHALGMPRKQRRIALRSALAAKAVDGAIQVVASFEYERPRTKDFATFLEKAGAGRRVLVVVEAHIENLELSARNIPQVKLILASNINVRDVLIADTIIVTKEALDAITEHLG